MSTSYLPTMPSTSTYSMMSGGGQWSSSPISGPQESTPRTTQYGSYPSPMGSYQSPLESTVYPTSEYPSYRSPISRSPQSLHSMPTAIDPTLDSSPHLDQRRSSVSMAGPSSITSRRPLAPSHSNSPSMFSFATSTPNSHPGMFPSSSESAILLSPKQPSRWTPTSQSNMSNTPSYGSRTHQHDSGSHYSPPQTRSLQHLPELISSNPLKRRREEESPPVRNVMPCIELPRPGAKWFTRRSRNGAAYTVCPKQQYRCLYGEGCTVVKEKACQIKDHYQTDHARFNCIQCADCGGSYARPCTYKRHLKAGKCPKKRPLTPEQICQGKLRDEIMKCFQNMTDEASVLRGLKTIKECNMKDNMHKRKRCVGPNRRSGTPSPHHGQRIGGASQAGDSEHSSYTGMSENEHLAEIGMASTAVTTSSYYPTILSAPRPAAMATMPNFATGYSQSTGQGNGSSHGAHNAYPYSNMYSQDNFHESQRVNMGYASHPISDPYSSATW
ncbi:hypothetical protein DFH27DRAFT_299099 [Peziza echinospora]|nr:hypothetical protein DFH27DRAFT_299099 [Peziza echinospora]